MHLLAGLAKLSPLLLFFLFGCEGVNELNEVNELNKQTGNELGGQWVVSFISAQECPVTMTFETMNTWKWCSPVVFYTRNNFANLATPGGNPAVVPPIVETPRACTAPPFYTENSEGNWRGDWVFQSWWFTDSGNSGRFSGWLQKYHNGIEYIFPFTVDYSALNSSQYIFEGEITLETGDQTKILGLQTDRIPERISNECIPD